MNSDNISSYFAEKYLFNCLMQLYHIMDWIGLDNIKLVPYIYWPKLDEWVVTFGTVKRDLAGCSPRHPPINGHCTNHYYVPLLSVFMCPLKIKRLKYQRFILIIYFNAATNIITIQVLTSKICSLFTSTNFLLDTVILKTKWHDQSQLWLQINSFNIYDDQTCLFTNKFTNCYLFCVIITCPTHRTALRLYGLWTAQWFSF